MGEFIIKMPDVGEGVAEAEIVEWHVRTGDPVREDMPWPPLASFFATRNTECLSE